MENVESMPPPRPPRLVLLAWLSGLGIGLGVGATVLGVWGRFGTESTDIDSWHGRLLDGAAERIAVTGAAVGAVIAIGLVAYVVFGRRRPGPTENDGCGLGFLILFAIMVLVGVMLSPGEPWHLAEVWSQTRQSYPFSLHLPMVYAAYLLAAAALLLVIVGNIRFRNFHRLPPRVLGVAVVIGILVSTVAALGAVQLSDDTVNIDRSTVGATEALAVPARVSGEAFRVTLDGENFPYSSHRRDIVATAPGFVVGTKDGIVAYDGLTGERRWHYQRVAQSASPLLRLHRYDYSLISADGGNVVLASWEKVGTVAFDAATGETLWTRKPAEDRFDDFDFRPSYWGSSESTPRLLFGTRGNEFAAFDPRTGRQLWLAASKVPDCTLEYRVVTTAGLYQVRECEKAPDRTTRTHITALDPETGDIVATRDFEWAPGIHSDIRVSSNGSALVVEFPRRSADSTVLVVTEPEQLTDAPLLEIPDFSTVLGSNGDGTQLLVQRRWRGADHGYTSHLVSVADTPMGPVLSDSRVDHDETSLWVHSVFLADQLVQFSYATPYPGPEYTLLRRWDSAGVGEEPIDISLDWILNTWDRRSLPSPALIPVNGSLLLVLAGEGGSITIIGLR